VANANTERQFMPRAIRSGLQADVRA